MGMLYHEADILNQKIKLKEPLNPREKENLKMFKDLQKKYKFNYLKDFTNSEIKKEKLDLLMQGVWVDKFGELI
jgi:hypothetical protein